MSTINKHPNNEFHWPEEDWTKEIDELRRAYGRAIKISEEDIQWLKSECLSKVGDEIFADPEWPNSTSERVRLFKDYYAQIQFIIKKHEFLANGLTIETARAELERINSWTTEAEKINILDAMHNPRPKTAKGDGDPFFAFKLNNSPDPKYEFRRLIFGFYDKPKMTRYLRENPILAHIYAEYVLMKKWLQRELDILQRQQRKKPNLCPQNIKAALNLIEPSFYDRFKIIEEKVDPTNKTKIKVAAFCQLLFEKKFFVSKTNRVQTISQFASMRYGLDIRNQLRKTKQSSRKTHEQQLKRHFA